MASPQHILAHSPEARDHAAPLFGASTLMYANGEWPFALDDPQDVIAVGPDAEWCNTLCGIAASLNCAKIRFAIADLTQIEGNPLKWLRERLQPYQSSAPQTTPVIAIPPIPSPEPAAAETTGPPDEPPLEHARSAQDEAVLDLHASIPPEGAETAQAPFKRKPKRPRLASVDGNLARAPDPEDEPLPASLSEDALSEHFVETRGEKWRYVPEWGVWLEWRGDGWHRDTLSKVAHECKEITRECLKWDEARTLTPDGKRKISSKRMAWNVRDMAEVHPKISIHATELDADPMLLGVPGGVVDLKTGKHLEADPTDYITRRTLVAPEEGPHPLFDRVLERACNGHEGMRGYLIRSLGMCLSGLCTEEVFFYLVGQGGSGKGSLTGALQAIWGDYADTIAMDALIETKQQRHTQEIAKLEGMRLVLASEAEEGVRFNSALIQRLTGADVITAHRMRMDDHSYKPQFKLLLSGNSTPHIKSVSDGAMKRRIHLIEYAPAIAEEDKDTTLKARMVAEYPAILHTLIHGCVDWQDCHGLGKPESVTASVDGYLAEEDSFAEFINECIHTERGASERSSEVYRRYLDWAREAGEKYTLSMKRFVQTMRARGYESTRSAAGRFISGLTLLPHSVPAPGRSYQDQD